MREKRPMDGVKTMPSRTVETGARGRAVDVDGHGRGIPSSQLRARARDAPPGDVQGREGGAFLGCLPELPAPFRFALCP